MIASVSTSAPACQSAFLRLLPAIRRYARFSFRHLRPSRREEAVSEAIAAAFVAFVRLAERGKQGVYPTTGDDGMTKTMIVIRIAALVLVAGCWEPASGC
jgi:hypothetical protein